MQWICCMANEFGYFFRKLKPNLLAPVHDLRYIVRIYSSDMDDRWVQNLSCGFSSSVFTKTHKLFN